MKRSQYVVPCLALVIAVVSVASTAVLAQRVGALENEQREVIKEQARIAIIASQSEEQTPLDKSIDEPENVAQNGDFGLDSVMKQTSIGEIEITHYCDCEICNGKWAGQTASGAVPAEGRTIACDFLPFGTIVNIGGNLYTVEDRAGDGRTDHIDIFVADHQRALDAGKYRLECYVVNFEEGEE